MIMRVLLIGGNGFIGSHLVDVFVEGGASVRVLDRKPEAFRPPVAGVEYVVGDALDAAVVRKALIGVDSVIHLASTTVPATSNLDPANDIISNLVPMVRLLEVMREVGVRNVLFLSSGGTVYGIPETDPVNEGHPLRPLSSYGIVKVAIEKYLYMESRLHGLRYTVLRASNPYGPRQGHMGLQGVIGTYLWRLARGESVEVWGDGSVVRDFIHVRDLAELCALAITAQFSGVFNAGSGDGVSISQILPVISEVVGRPIVPVYKPGRGFDVPRVVLDIGKAKKAFDWSPRIGLTAGIAEAWVWVRKQQA